MKTYIVYFNGIEVGYVKAGNHNAAEKKARAKADMTNAAAPFLPGIKNVSVAYTEL